MFTSGGGEISKLYALPSRSLQSAYEESHTIDQIWLNVIGFKIEILYVTVELQGRKWAHLF